MIEKVKNFLFENSQSKWLWFIVRIYVGFTWLDAGWAKVTNPAWSGWHAGAPLTGFINGALAKTLGAHPDVQSWYAFFLKTFILSYVNLWSHVVSYGELFVGIALILGIFTTTAAFFGAFMNFNYLMAGAISINPILFILEILLICAYKIVGKIGLEELYKKKFSKKA